MAKYSVSQIQVYIQCPLKYRYRYIDKIPLVKFVESADTLLGKIVHSTLEYLYNQVNIYRILTKKQMLLYYFNLREKNEKSVFEDNGEIKIFNIDLTIDDYKRRGEVYLSIYYDHYFVYKDLCVVGTEKQISFSLCEGAVFQGFIDRLDKIGDTFVIDDYKTNKNLPTEEKKQYVEQLTLYGLGIKQQYGKYIKNLKAKIYFLHFDIVEERELTEENMDLVRQKYINLINEIEQKKVQFIMGSKKIFIPNQSPLCARCDYQSICPLFSAVTLNDDVFNGVSEGNINSVVDEFISLDDKISTLEKQKELLIGILKSYVIKKDPDDFCSDFLLSGNSGNLIVTKNQNVSVIDKDRFLSKIKELGLFEKYADISGEDVNKLFFDSLKVRFGDFKGLVEGDIIYTVQIKKKKD